MSGSQQQLDKIFASDIQLMSTVPFSQPLSAHSVWKTFLPMDRQERLRTLGSPNVVLVRGVASLVVMLADIAVAVHDGRQ